MLFKILPQRFLQLLFRNMEAKEAFLSQVAELRAQFPGRPVAFAVMDGGILEYLTIRNFLEERFGPQFSTHRTTRVGVLWNRDHRLEKCSQELKAGRPIIVNLESGDRKKAFEPPASERELAYLLSRHPDLLVVPVVFIWRRARALEDLVVTDVGERTWRAFKQTLLYPWHMLLGDIYRPSGIRKLLILLRGYARSALRLTPAIDARAENLDSKTVRRRILINITQEKRVIIGPTFRSTRLLGEGILRGRPFQNFIKNLASQEGVSERSLLIKADRIFREIAAHYSYATIEVFSWMLGKVFTTIFEGITTRPEDFEKLRASAKEGALVFVPCHRSYVDFLLLSHLLFNRGIAPPHVAAGINLNFWPMGKIFKNGGAFFIRRSFKGNVLYAEVLRRYVAALLSNRVNLEFFIEGTRSRNGKLAPPKYGILKMITDSYLEGTVRERVRFVPVSITYDQVTESGAHKRELEGGAKVEENMLNAVKSTQVLFRRYGKVHVRFADAIKIEDWMKSDIGEGKQSLDTRRLGVQKLAFEICHRINRVTPLTAEGLVCGVVLAKPGAALMKGELEQWCERMKQDLEALDVLLSDDLKNDFMKSCRRAMARMIENKVLEKYHGPTNAIGLRIPRKQRIAALYNKNSVVHAFTLAGIKGLVDPYTQEGLELRSLLQFEFFFEEKEVYLKRLQSLPSSLMSPFYAYWFDDVLENLNIGLRCLMNAKPTLAADAKEWKMRLMKYGQTALLESSIVRLEAVNTQSFAAFIEMSQNKNWLVKNSEGALVPGSLELLERALDRVQYFRNKLAPWEEVRKTWI